MGVGAKRRAPPPLPAPTETNSTILTGAPSDVGTDAGTDVSKPGDEQSSYSLPDDGTPVTIRTGHRASKSQTSLLIEYFEGGKSSTASGTSEQRKPSVRVRVTPSHKHRSKGGSDRDRIKITQSKSRKTSPNRRSAPSIAPTRSEIENLSLLSGDMEDAGSYASATEESNVSRNPIDIEIDRSGNVRRRRPASPLIPAADSKASYHAPTMSEISAIPADSFLDGSGPATSFGHSEIKSTRSRSPSRTGDYLLGAAAGLGAAAAADKLRNKSRETRERDTMVVSKNRDKDKDRKHRSSKSRTSSSSMTKEEKYAERAKSPRRRSKGPTATDSLISGADSSIVSSAFAPSHRSMDQHSIRSGTSKASSINNPKLLETVEDAIRRLILPELNALKREQSRSKSRRDSTTSSTTTASRDDYDRRRSGVSDKNMVTPRDSMRSKESRDREARNDFDDSSALSHDSVEDAHDLDDTPMRSTDRLKNVVAAGAAMGAAAVAAHEILQSPSDDKQRSRRRRRAEMRGRGSDLTLEEEESELGPPVPPMPLMSDVNASDVTRASILSADTDRPHSASEELAPGRGLHGDQPSPSTTPTPTRNSINLQSLGTQHANISHGDLKTLPHQRTGEWDEFIIDDNGKRVPSRASKHYQEDEEEEEEDSETAPAYAPDSPYDYYSTQDVPPPLKYVPYQPERRGLSPIPSVSGYTDAGSEAPNHESRAAHRTAESVSSAGRRDGSIHSRPSREVMGDDRSVRSSALHQESAMSPANSDLDAVASGQAVRAVGLNPDFVHPPGIGIESNVASLVDGSMLDSSVLTGSSSAIGNQAYNGRESMATLEEERSRDPGTPTKRSVGGSQRDYAEERGETPASGRSREFVEYDLDEYGRKVPQTTYRQSPTVSEAAITSAAVGAAAAVLRAQNAKGQQVVSDDEIEFQGEGVQRNKSFKERTQTGPRPGMETASAESLVNKREQPKLGFSSMPDPSDPMPEIGDWQEDDLLTNPSLLGGEGGRDEEEHWGGDATPRQHPQHREDDIEYHDLDRSHASPALSQQNSGHGLGMAGVAGAAAALGAAAAMAGTQNHSRQASQEHDEWYRTSEDKKRDTLITNPYEDSSPVANLPDMNGALLGGQGFDNSGFGGDLYATRSPLGHKVDEGYISQGPNRTPDMQGAKGKGVDFDAPGGPGVEDPFYSTPQHTRHLSGMSQGMGSPMYEAATGAGIDSIESKDIIALMQHLMVRDAQRSARDTEILVTLVRSATEMRNNFEDIKRLLADTEDVIITEVKDNTEKSVQRAINGPRPYPGSAPRSIQGGSQAGTINGDDINAKKRSIFRRALKGLNAKGGANDLGRIEDMLMQLLTEVDVLKAQTAPGNQGDQSYDSIQPDLQDEQDHGYEPDGMAGTSTASHASQSGFLSIQSRGTSSIKPGYDRKVSTHRISTVPEDNEEDYDHGRRNDEQHLMTPAQDQRGSSVPLATPPGAAAQAQTSMSNENTPRTEESGKKHKSGRSSWFRIPKISRWSETTASSGVPESRHSKQSSKDDNGQFPTGPSRSGSLDHYQDNYQFAPPQPLQTDKLHTGFSETDLPQGYHEEHDEQMYGQMSSPSQDANWVSMNMTPEDPKYKAHRDSLNLVHPQPRQGQTERFKAALESQALGYDSSLGPKSADWAGSATSLHRFGQPMHQHQHTDSYGSAGDHHYQQQQQQQQQHWSSSPTTATGPPRPPKEALDNHVPSSPSQLTRSNAGATPPTNKRLSKLQKKNGSPLPHHSVESGYGTMTHGVPTASYISQRDRDSRHISEGEPRGSSPRLESNRMLAVATADGGVNRRPSGPRPMTPTGTKGGASGLGAGRSGSEGSFLVGDERRKRDTFGSQDTDTF